MAAYALARFKFVGQRTVLMFLITTQMFPLVLLCIPYFRIFITLGLYDTRTSLVIVYLTFTLPFCILMLRSYFMNIPRDIEEAAMVDGCTRLGAMFRTLVPMSYPAFIGAGLYTFLLAWNEFLFAVVLIESWENRVLTMAIYSLMAEFVTLPPSGRRGADRRQPQQLRGIGPQQRQHQLDAAARPWRQLPEQPAELLEGRIGVVVHPRGSRAASGSRRRGRRA